jgi:mono/diheme cytochrome c family protein
VRLGWKTCGALGLLVMLLASWNWRTAGHAAPKAPEPAQAAVERGKYLVNEVARCCDCHTPRNAKGKLDFTRNLQGAPTWYKPAKRVGEWEDKAPDITASGKAGKWTEEKMIKFLSTGKKSDPPMPAYKLSEADARAVTAYLRSLPGKNNGRGRKDDDD